MCARLSNHISIADVDRRAIVDINDGVGVIGFSDRSQGIQGQRQVGGGDVHGRTSRPGNLIVARFAAGQCQTTRTHDSHRLGGAHMFVSHGAARIIGHAGHHIGCIGCEHAIELHAA